MRDLGKDPAPPTPTRPVFEIALGNRRGARRPSSGAVAGRVRCRAWRRRNSPGADDLLCPLPGRLPDRDLFAGPAAQPGLSQQRQQARIPAQTPPAVPRTSRVTFRGSCGLGRAIAAIGGRIFRPGGHLSGQGRRDRPGPPQAAPEFRHRLAQSPEPPLQAAHRHPGPTRDLARQWRPGQASASMTAHSSASSSIRSVESVSGRPDRPAATVSTGSQAPGPASGSPSSGHPAASCPRPPDPKTNRPPRPPPGGGARWSRSVRTSRAGGRSGRRPAYPTYSRRGSRPAGEPDSGPDPGPGGLVNPGRGASIPPGIAAAARPRSICPDADADLGEPLGAQRAQTGSPASSLSRKILRLPPGSCAFSAIHSGPRSGRCSPSSDCPRTAPGAGPGNASRAGWNGQAPAPSFVVTE